MTIQIHTPITFKTAIHLLKVNMTLLMLKILKILYSAISENRILSCKLQSLSSPFRCLLVHYLWYPPSIISLLRFLDCTIWEPIAMPAASSLGRFSSGAVKFNKCIFNSIYQIQANCLISSVCFTYFVIHIKYSVTRDNSLI